jgi:hypothetical protein
VVGCRCAHIAEGRDGCSLRCGPDLCSGLRQRVVSAGGNVLALARTRGHQSPKEMLKTYADLFESDLDALAHVLDEPGRRQSNHQSLPLMTVNWARKT